LLSDKTLNFINEHNFKTLIHTSWFTLPKKFWDSEYNDTWKEASIKLFQNFLANNGKRIVSIGSCAEYQWGKVDYIKENSVENFSSAYSRNKLDVLHWLQENKVEFVWPRVFFQFGGNEHLGRLIPTIIDASINQTPLILEGSNIKRDYVFVDDVAKAVFEIERNKSAGVVNIGQGVGIEVKEVLGMIRKIVNKHDQIIIKQTFEPKYNIVSDPTVFNLTLPNFKWTRIEEALKKSIKIREGKRSE
jgi:nucleoside-diphosphate-sugar epimerase